MSFYNYFSCHFEVLQQEKLSGCFIVELMLSIALDLQSGCEGAPITELFYAIIRIIYGAT